MTRLIIIGVVSAFFFSSTFVLNRAMSLQGGHWVWTASLRYAYMLVMMSGWLVVTGKSRLLGQVFSAYRRNWCFWTIAGSTGFGMFYSLLTFSASFAPGWVVATTWQSTILATPVVLLLFGKRVPVKGMLFTALIFAGIVLVTYEQATAASVKDMMLGIFPVIAAAFAYPIGNQLIWEARHGSSGIIARTLHPPPAPHIEGSGALNWRAVRSTLAPSRPDRDSPIAPSPLVGEGWGEGGAATDAVLDSSIGRVLIMVLGSMPFWIALTLILRPPPPSPGQLINTAVVAVLSGVVATTLFYHARQSAKTAFELSAVDATQSTEVIFSLLGEILFLHGSFPGMAGCLGITLSIIGLVLYVRSQAAGER